MICFENCMPLAQFIFASGFFLALCIGIVCQILLRLTLDRRVRSELPADKIYNGFYDSYFGIWRALLFANASILPGKRFKRTMEIFYNGFDVRNFANSFEKTVAYIHIICAFILILFIPLFFITKAFGIFNW
jgi:hypothetical protein